MARLLAPAVTAAVAMYRAKTSGGDRVDAAGTATVVRSMIRAAGRGDPPVRASTLTLSEQSGSTITQVARSISVA